MDTDKIKNHFKKYKWYYIIGGSLVFAGVTGLILRKNLDLLCGSNPHLLCGSGGSFSNLSISRGIPVTASRGIPVTGENSGFIFNNQQGLVNRNTMNITQVVDSLRRGAPSWVVRCLETGEAFMSQRAAANAMGLSEAEISRHLNGALDHVRGYHFDRICMAA